MARATTKLELTAAASDNYEKLWNLISSMSQEEQVATLYYGESFKGKEAHWERDKNLRDVLIHLYEWHQLLLRWIDSNKNGQITPFLPAPYNWKTYGSMNVEFWEKHQVTDYVKSKEMLIESHKNVMEIIESFTDEELFEKKYFTWTGTSSLGAYCISATSSHYDWAIKKIKQHMKATR